MIAQLNSLMPQINEFFYTLAGLVSILTGIRGLKNKKSPVGTFAFWTILGVLFIVGQHVITAFGDNGAAAIGMSLFILAALTVTKQVQIGEFTAQPVAEKEAAAAKLGNKIFVPAVTLAVVAMGLAQIKIPYTAIVDGVETTKNFTFSGAAAIGIASLVALIIGYVLTNAKTKDVLEDSTRLMMTVGSAALLPQLLGSLGSLFAAAGVGNVISNLMSGVIPSNSILIGVIVYVVGMALFTMIMGNAFAAFPVLSAGIALPFLINVHHGNPAPLLAIGMYAGYCGTLMTPMAANFNIVPAALLELKDKYQVIKIQIPTALTLLVVNVFLMYFLVFR